MPTRNKTSFILATIRFCTVFHSFMCAHAREYSILTLPTLFSWESYTCSSVKITHRLVDIKIIAATKATDLFANCSHSVKCILHAYVTKLTLMRRECCKVLRQHRIWCLCMCVYDVRQILRIQLISTVNVRMHVSARDSIGVSLRVQKITMIFVVVRQWSFSSRPKLSENAH